MTTEVAESSARLKHGIVLKNKMEKTVVVEVTRHVSHRKYQKFVKSRTRYKAHDETNACHVGDTVVLEETKPMSRTKRWRVKEILKRASEA